jgi:hypothetical protein
VKINLTPRPPKESTLISTDWEAGWARTGLEVLKKIIMTFPLSVNEPQTVSGSFPRVKRPGPGVDHPPLSSAEVKDSVKL